MSAEADAAAAVAAASLSTDQSTTVTFESGLNANGTVATTAYDTWNGNNPATYDTGSPSVSKWQGGSAGTAGGTVNYYFTPSSGWTAAEQASFTAGLALWSAVANIQFAQTNSANAAALTFTRAAAGSSEAETSHSSSGFESSGGTTLMRTTSATVVIDTSQTFWSQLGSFTVAGGYGVDTVVHEEGHVLGLGHAGAYNGDVNAATQQDDSTDSRQWSIMSYIDPSITTAKYYSSYSVTGTVWGRGSDGYSREPTTWMPLDILAAQRLYGVAVGGPLSGGQTFGFHTNIASSIANFFDFTVNTSPVVTLYDSGVGNTLDLSGFAAASTVNLNPGTASSADGMTNNIMIAFNTAIDTVIGGVGNDVFTVNADNDTLNGGGGMNTAVFAGSAAQYRISVAGTVTTVTDTVSGRNGTDTLRNVQFLQFSDSTVAVPSAHTTDLNGDGLSDIVLQAYSGQSVVYSMNGGSISAGTMLSNFGTNTQIVATGDFNGDGTTDVLVQGPNCALTVFLVSGDHYTSGISLGSYGSSWSVAGTGDFNGDGKSDILMQNGNGSLVCFTMDGGKIVAGTSFGNNGSGGGRVVGIGDFNGDGTSDMLVYSGLGTLTIFTVKNDAFTSGTTIGTYNGLRIGGVGDYNGDGKADILLQNPADHNTVVFSMNGGSITAGTSLGNFGGATVVASGDYNGDGTSDIVTQGTNGALTLFTVVNDSLTAGYSLGNPGTAWHFIDAGRPGSVITSPSQIVPTAYPTADTELDQAAQSGAAAAPGDPAAAAAVDVPAVEASAASAAAVLSDPNLVTGPMLDDTGRTSVIG